VADGVGPQLTVAPLTAERWDGAVGLFGTRGDPASCWCQFFRLTGSQWKASTRSGNRRALAAQAASQPPPGLLAFLHGEPVGWLALAPRTAYARLQANRALAAVSTDDLDNESVWSVTCFVVRVGFRGQGVATELLAAAPDFARRHGATVLEAYPVDVQAARKKSNAELYHGVASSFAAAGYVEVGRTGPTRPVMRLFL
jgi:GNAT superfamily N-acetyltransferase